MGRRFGELWDLFTDAGFPLQEGQRWQFERYLVELLKWNRTINLTALTREEDIIIKHFLGSLTFLYGFELTPQLEVLDLGSGGGFPGLPIKIVCPQISLTLIEAGQKKVAFLKHIGRTLDLKGVRYEAQRSEALVQQSLYNEFFDIVLCRAIGKLYKMVAFSFPLLKSGGSLITQKGLDFETEVEAIAETLIVHHATLERVIPVNLPWSETSYVLLVIRKTP